MGPFESSLGKYDLPHLTRPNLIQLPVPKGFLPANWQFVIKGLGVQVPRRALAQLNTDDRVGVATAIAPDRTLSGPKRSASVLRHAHSSVSVWPSAGA